MGARRFERIEHACRILQSIASDYPQGSEESWAMEMAATALIYAVSEHPDDFKKYMQDDELTAEQKERLLRMGLEP